MKKIILLYFLFSFVLYAGHDHNHACERDCSATPNLLSRDFANVLRLAKFSSCENIAYKFSTLSRFDGFGKLIEKELNVKTKGLFPWRAEVTNGYKEGFFYHVLKGIALENKGDIISAYNEFCYSLSYIDETKSLVYPNSRHEVELAIAKIYLQIGRLYDAQEWFDSVRIESSDNNILVAADSGLIARAVAIGNYKEACDMCEDLGTLTTLTREQFNAYAKVLFSLGRDRDAFAQLLSGIAKYGFDENLGLKDPMVDLFLNALPRATDEEIEWYYDLVGYGIMESRAQKGDEKHLAMLLKTRMLFSTVFSFLKSEDDMKKLEKRIEYLKTNVVYRSTNRYRNKTAKSDLILGYTKRKIKTSNLTNSFNDTTPEFKLELMLMKAEYLLFKSENASRALELLKKFNMSLTNKNFKEFSYDNCTFEQLGKIDAIIAKGIKYYNKNMPLPKKMVNKPLDITFNGSQKMASMYLLLSFIIKTNQSCLRECISTLPRFNQMTLRWLEFKVINAINNNKLKEAASYSKQYYEFAGQLTPDIYHKMVFVYAALGQTEKAFNVAMQGLLYFLPFRLSDDFHYAGAYWYRKLCRSIFSWAKEDDIQKFNRIQLISELPEFLMKFNPKLSTRRLHNALQWQSKFGENELNFRTAYNNENYMSALDVLTNKFAESKQAGHLYKEAICWDKIGNSSNAFYRMLESIKTRRNFAINKVKKFNYTTTEISFLEKCAVNEKTKKLYLDILNNKIDNYEE